MSYAAVKSGFATRRALEVQAPAPRRNSANRRRYRELALKVSALQKDYAELHTALFEAAQVHRRLCAPRLVQYGDFAIASETFAVRHVPGDLFMIEETPRGAVMALSDICGKGLAAGMWTTYLAGLVSAHTEQSVEPRFIVAGVNSDFCRMASVAPLATMFLGLLNPDTGVLEYCSAGHPSALLLRADGKLELLSDGGPMLGVVPTARYEQGTVQMFPGDILVTCSDGILESFNEAEQEFGSARLETELRCAQNSSAGAVLFSLLGAVQDFASPRPLTDDMTLVVVKSR